MSQIVLNNRMVDYIMKRTNRKSIALEVTADGKLIVRAPLKVPIRQIEELMVSKQEWIFKHMNACEKKQNSEDGDAIWYLGKRYPVCVREHKENTMGITIEDKNIIIKKPYGYNVAIHPVLETWLRRHAAAVIGQKVKQYSLVMGVTYNNITIKDQKTRWGSCSGKGNLNFNYRLIMAPEEVLEYVVVHELAHRVHMDHSKQFWSVVESILPNYKELRNWLKEHGHELTL